MGRRCRFVTLGLLVLLALGMSACGIPVEPTPPLEASGNASDLPLPTRGDEPAPMSLTPSPQPTYSLALHLAANPMPPRTAGGLVGASWFSSDLISEPLNYAIGAPQRFWVADQSPTDPLLITATLVVELDHVQMWVEQGVDVDEGALAQSARVFEYEIYPRNRALFGSEWTPGIDGDAHLVILNLGSADAAGYFAGGNEYSRTINAYSNEHEMFVMNLGVLDPGTSGYESVLAHEFQHMIHWHQDSNESAWVNEGASQLAEELNGFGWPLGVVASYSGDPDIQLNTWPDDERVFAHYGAAYLFVRYFYDRFGGEALRELIAQPADGIEGLKQELQSQAPDLTFAAFYADWLVANVVDDPDWDDGRFGYPLVEISVSRVETLEHLPALYQGTVSQYGVDYLALPAGMAGPVELDFTGDAATRLVPTDPSTGQWMWWSNRGDSGHSWLEHSFDLGEVFSASLDFDLWYDLEPGWDYAYVRISRDGGMTWEWAETPSMTRWNPNGNALGPGFTGTSGTNPTEGQQSEARWVRERVDLTPYAGDQIIVRFDYLTDDAVNYPGLCIDHVVVDAIQFGDDVEAGEGQWRAAGFVRHDNTLSQSYLVQWVVWGRDVRVHRWWVEGVSGDSWRISDLPSTSERGVIIVSALAPSTTERASYRLELENLP